MDQSTSPLVAFAGGGTGGHLYPAIALARALRDRLPNLRLLFLGTQRPVDRHILSQVDAEFAPQTLPTFSPWPWKWPKMVLTLRRATNWVRRRFESDWPLTVIGSGGMASVPAIRAARSIGIPYFLLNPDALPGRANRVFAKFAESVYVQWEEAAAAIPHARSVSVLGCPIRTDFRDAVRERGIARFQLDPLRSTLLVTGASQGARTINDAVIANADWLRGRSDWQILHLTGRDDFDRVKEAYARLGVAGTVESYTDHMVDALAACDLVISRAGASTLAEITALGKPSILMPYPFHKDQHQVANAACLVRAGAAVLIEDRRVAELNAPRLRAALDSLTRDGEARDTMTRAARRLGRLDAASEIAEDVLTRCGVGASRATNDSLERTCGLAR